MSATEMVVNSSQEVARFMPVMEIAAAIQRYNALLDFTQQIMKQGKDYGVVPGSDKPTLLKPGAEKLCNFFGLTPKFELVERIEQWTGEEPFFYYFYRCRLYRGEYLIAEADGSCNTRESKYRYRWVNESQLQGLDKGALVSRGGRVFEFDFAINKADTTGKYGKPGSYWQAFRDAIQAGAAYRTTKPTKGGDREGWEIDSTVYRVPNPDICDQVNTCQKMAQKRALIAVTLIGCNASEYYTQDLEDMEAINVSFAEPKAEPKHEPTAAQLPAELEALFTPNSPKGSTKTALETCRRELVEAMPQNGEEEYHRILERNGVTRESIASGAAKVRNIATACAQMWTLAQSAKRLKPNSKPQPAAEMQPEEGEWIEGAAGYDPKDDYRK